MKKTLLSKHDKIVWDIVLPELFKLKAEDKKSWIRFELKRREFVVYRRK